jgi:hypothetical protein
MSTETIVEVLPGDEPQLDPKRYWSLAVIAIAQLMIVLDASVVVVALPSAVCCCSADGSPTTSAGVACLSLA